MNKLRASCLLHTTAMAAPSNATHNTAMAMRLLAHAATLSATRITALRARGLAATSCSLG